jgi:Mycobacterium membrane protein
MVKVLRRFWVPVLIVAVILVGAFMVDRLRGVFGKTELTRPGAGLVNDPEPFNPKEVRYEIFGEPGATATINYLDLDAQPQKAVNVTLPWSLTLTTTAPAASPNIVAQGDGDSISCRITVDGVVKDEKTTDGLNAQTFCLVKSA